MTDFMRTKFKNPKLEQSELANQLGYSFSTLQRYKNDKKRNGSCLFSECRNTRSDN